MLARPAAGGLQRHHMPLFTCGRTSSSKYGYAEPLVEYPALREPTRIDYLMIQRRSAVRALPPRRVSLDVRRREACQISQRCVDGPLQSTYEAGQSPEIGTAPNRKWHTTDDRNHRRKWSNGSAQTSNTQVSCAMTTAARRVSDAK